MKLPATQALYAYWTSRCGGRSAPDRHDLDPAEMRGVLPYTFMLEVDGPAGAYPIRISGTRLEALFGRDLKSQAFTDLWASEDRAEMRALIAGVLDDARPAIAGVRGAPDGYASSSFELLLLPLRHHGRTHARLLCSLVPSTTPTWIGLQTVAGLVLSSWRSIDRSVEVAAERTRSGHLRREHLVVFEGGRGEEATLVHTSQSRVKAVVPRSRDMLLTTRRS